MHLCQDAFNSASENMTKNIILFCLMFKTTPDLLQGMNAGRMQYARES